MWLALSWLLLLLLLLLRELAIRRIRRLLCRAPFLLLLLRLLLLLLLLLLLRELAIRKFRCFLCCAPFVLLLLRLLLLVEMIEFLMHFRRGRRPVPWHWLPVVVVVLLDLRIVEVDNRSRVVRFSNSWHRFPRSAIPVDDKTT